MPSDGGASEWTEHTHSDGRRYYYNKSTKASSWDKPEVMKSAEEKLNTTPWKEYKTAEGRDYFFNPETKQSVWEMPDELKRIRGLQKDDDSDDDDRGREPKAEWSSAEQRRAAFKELLEEKSVKCTMKWEEALKKISDDRRFNALTTAGERKQVFAEYVTQTKKREKDEEREKKKRAKDDFLEALNSWQDLKPTSRYKDAAEEFMDEDWFKLIEEEDRDELFQDFMDEHEKKQKEERRKTRKEYVEKIKEIYQDHKDISVLSRWRDVQETLRDDETFRWLSKLEALTSWEEWVQEKEKKELEALSTSKYRVQRQARDSFRDLLREQHAAGKIKMEGTKWSEVAHAIQEESRYVGLIGVGGGSCSTPHDVFDDFVEEINEKYKEDRARIKKWAKAKGLVVTSSSTASWFHDQLKGEEGYMQVPEEHRKLTFESLILKAKEQDEDAEKNAKKNRKKFVELLQKTRDVSANTTYEQATGLLGHNATWDAVDEHTRRQCFDIFVDQLKIQSESRKANAGGDDGSDSDGGRRKDKKGGKKRKDEEPTPNNGKKAKRKEEEEDDEPSKKHKRKK